MKNITFSINNRIKEILENQNISIVALSKELEITPQSLSRMLNSDDLKVSTVVKIATILDIPVSTFFEEFDKDLPPAPQKIDAIYERLSEVWQMMKKQSESAVSVAS